MIGVAQVMVVVMAGAKEGHLLMPRFAFWWIGMVRGMFEVVGKIV